MTPVPLQFNLQRFALCTAIVVFSASALCLPNRAFGNDERARKLAPLLKAAPRSAKGTKADIGAPKDVTIKIIEQLHTSNRTSGPSAQSLIETAYRFRPDVAPLESLLTTATLVDNWREAEALGLFDDNNRFHPIITRGPDKGEPVAIEYIVLPEHMPEMSKHPANVRLVPPSRKRLGKGKTLTEREVAYRDQFTRMIEEAIKRAERLIVEKGTNFGAAALTPEEEHERWLGSMRRFGEEAKETPNVTLRARTGATPAHANKYRWRIDVEVANITGHPSEVQLQYWLVGISDKKNRHYAMKKATLKVELLPNQVKQLTLWTGPKSSYGKKAGAMDGDGKYKGKNAKVIFRGYLLRAMHGKTEVATLAPDLNLRQYLTKGSGQSVASLK